MNDSGYAIHVEPGCVIVNEAPNYVVRWPDQKEMLAETVEACQQAQTSRVLILGSTTRVEMSQLELFEMAKEVARLQLTVAIVSQHDATETDAQFFGNVASNRGAPVAFFESESDARTWLRSETD